MWVLVTGGRDFSNARYVWDCLDAFHKETPVTFLVHGAARGVDTFADGWAKSRGVQRISVPANWIGQGNAAGSLRNQLMLDLFSPDVVVAFPGGSGTHNMLTRAAESDIKTILAEEIIVP